MIVCLNCAAACQTLVGRRRCMGKCNRRLDAGPLTISLPACPHAHMTLQARAEDGQVCAVLSEERVISVTDMASETHERLEFRDPVLQMSLGARTSWVRAPAPVCVSPACCRVVSRRLRSRAHLTTSTWHVLGKRACATAVAGTRLRGAPAAVP